MSWPAGPSATTEWAWLEDEKTLARKSLTGSGLPESSADPTDVEQAASKPRELAVAARSQLHLAIYLGGKGCLDFRGGLHYSQFSPLFR